MCQWMCVSVTDSDWEGLWMVCERAWFEIGRLVRGLGCGGFGCYYVIIAISEFFASNIAGVVSQYFGQSRMFLASGVIAVFSLLVLIVIMGYKNKK